MPELPEVETVRRLLRRLFVGKRLVEVEVVPDEIVLSGHPAEAVHLALHGRTPTEIGRRGKFWWIEFAEAPTVFGHLGMAGWIRELPHPGSEADKEFRLKEHGNAPLYDETGRPRFAKLILTAEDGSRAAFTDSRRFARMWLGEHASVDPRVNKLGRDAHDDPPTVDDLTELLKRRKAPIKGILLDQSLFAGIGNWIADEILYHAGIAPMRPGNTLGGEEVARLQAAWDRILRHSVAVEADYERFPSDWLFHHRWGGSKGAEIIGGEAIVRETVAGRTSAWVPTRQK